MYNKGLQIKTDSKVHHSVLKCTISGHSSKSRERYNVKSNLIKTSTFALNVHTCKANVLNIIDSY